MCVFTCLEFITKYLIALRQNIFISKDKNQKLSITEVKLRILETVDNGLIAWASCVLNDAIYFNNIAVRLSLEGKIILTYPTTISKNESKYFYFNPISRDASKAFEEAIIGKLKLLGIGIK